MHKLIEYICDELEELERKAEKDGKLSMAEVEYMDTLAHAKKNLLKGEEMYDEEYSNRGGSYDGGMSRARRRDSMGRYSREGGMSYDRGYGRRGGYNRGRYSMNSDMVNELRDLMDEAPDDQTRMELQKLVQRLEGM
jgi:hypothetical protein